MNAFAPGLTASQARDIDRICDQFETEWRSSRRPDPSAYLGAAEGRFRWILLRQLLLLDWEYRRRAGDGVSGGDYLVRFPGDASLIHGVEREMSVSSTDTPITARDQARGAPWSGEREPIGDRRPDAHFSIGLDRYELVEEIGRGGIGVVYRARDRHLNRELAFKVLREEFRGRSDARERFVAEARIGGRLQHPAIVPVYEQGWFADEQPFLTMKVVLGRTLAELLNDRADPGRDLPRFLAVFEQVCQAVGYAHSQGVVHRDLKPANIMVGAFGEVQVMDWGFAKVLGDDRDERGIAPWPAANDGPSQGGQVLGTPRYMPPEQARGEAAQIDERADVFALGAILGEILTGAPPYGGGTADEVCRQAAAGDLADVLARLAASNADVGLKDLAQRCLANEPHARPRDAGVVAGEMAAYLESAQERLREAQIERAAAEARADEARAKARVERRARRLALALAAALLLGVGAASWQALVATRAKHETQVAADAEKAVLDFVLNRVIAPVRPEGLEGGLGREVTLRSALSSALPFVEKNFANQPLTEARLRVTLGDSFLYLGEAKIAEEQFQRAVALYTEHRGLDHPDTLTATTKLANSYADQNRYDDAVKLYEPTLAAQIAKLGADHSDTLYTKNYLGLGYFHQGKFQDALRVHQEVLAVRTTKLGPDHVDVIYSMNNVAMCFLNLSRNADGVDLFEKTLALKRVHLGPDHIDTLTGMQNLAIAYLQNGNLIGARNLLKEARPSLEAKLGRDHSFTLTCTNNLAIGELLLGNNADALKLFEETLAIQKTKLGPKRLETLRTMTNEASCLARLGRHEEALKLRQETLAIQKAEYANHPETLTSMNNLADSYASLGRYAEALPRHREALALLKSMMGSDHPVTLACMHATAKDLIALDHGPDAVPLLDEYLRLSVGKPISQELEKVVDLRLRYFAKAKDAKGCRTTAELWEAQQRTDAASLYLAARCRAVAAKFAGSDAAVEADRAITWLQKAVAAGFKDAAKLKNDRDFDVLRDRADFKALAETPENCSNTSKNRIVVA